MARRTLSDLGASFLENHALNFPVNDLALLTCSGPGMLLIAVFVYSGRRKYFRYVYERMMIQRPTFSYV